MTDVENPSNLWDVKDFGKANPSIENKIVDDTGWVEVKEEVKEEKKDDLSLNREKEVKEEKKDDLSLNREKELERKNEKITEYQKQIDEFKAKEKDEREKDMKKKGKLEELLQEKEAKITELSKHEEFYNKYSEKRNKELDTKIEKVPKEKQEIVNKLLERAESVDDKHDIVDAFVVESNDTFWKQPGAKAWHDVNKHAEAQKKGSIIDMINTAPIIN